MTQQPVQPGDPGPQPDAQFVIQAMNQELERTNNNRLWLMAMLEQRTAEVQQLSSVLSQVQAELQRLQAAEAAATPQPEVIDGSTGAEG